MCPQLDAKDCFVTTKPTPPVQELDVATVDGERFRLSECSPNAFTMIVFYRGFPFPICKPYLREMDHKLDEFASRGVDVIAVSTDTKERAARSREEWELGRLPVGYGLEIATARGWRLFISRGIKEPEPAEFAEPGLFLVRPGGTLYSVAVQSMPFARPHFSDVLAAIDYTIKNNYRPRGEAWCLGHAAANRGRAGSR
jgi:peroxiredoxin